MDEKRISKVAQKLHDAMVEGTALLRDEGLDDNEAIIAIGVAISNLLFSYCSAIDGGEMEALEHITAAAKRKIKNILNQ